MKPRSFIIVTTVVLLAGCFVLIAQDEPNAKSEHLKIGDLEQEVTDLQNEIRVMQTGATQQITNNEITAPQPEFGPGSGPVSNESTPNSVYSVQPPNASNSPAPSETPSYGYMPAIPRQPWAVIPPTHIVPTPADRYVPVQVPVFIETSPCCVDYYPVCDPCFPPAASFQFWFNGHGN